MQNKVHIEIEKIPEFQRISLAKGALALVEQVFSMPDRSFPLSAR